MKIGIIAEFNPLHSGHMHLIECVKKQYPQAYIYIIMSSFTMQRGEFSFIDPIIKTKLALSLGADFVFELPYVFSSQRADIFARGAIDISKKLSLDALAFGVEDFDHFQHLEQQQQKTSPDSFRFQSRIQSFNAQQEQFTHWNSSANNILAHFYIEQATLHYPELRFIPIKRKGSDYNDPSLQTNIASATAIRNAVVQGDFDTIQAFLPYSVENLHRFITWESLFPSFKHLLFTTQDGNMIATIGQSGLYQRFLKAQSLQTFEAFMRSVKTKAYTQTSIQRAMLFFFLQIRQHELDQQVTFAYTLPPRLLGVKESVSHLLKSHTYIHRLHELPDSDYKSTLLKIEKLYYTYNPQPFSLHFPFIFKENMA